VSSKPFLVIIDDEADIGDLITDVATPRGFDVQAFTAADEAFQVLEKHPPQLIVMDLMMPGIDGVEMLRYLAQHAKKSKLCLISGSDVTVLNSARRLASAHGLNVIAVFEKPLDIFKLRETFDDIAKEFVGC